MISHRILLRKETLSDKTCTDKIYTLYQ